MHASTIFYNAFFSGPLAHPHFCSPSIFNSFQTINQKHRIPGTGALGAGRGQSHVGWETSSQGSGLGNILGSSIPAKHV